MLTQSANQSVRFLFVIFTGVLWASACTENVICAGTAPSAEPTAFPPVSITSADLDHGSDLRVLLLDLLERACANDGIWPPTLPAQKETSGLLYLPPPKIADHAVADEFARARVVLRESTARGWVGYADGHLEFVSSRNDRDDCLLQTGILDTAIKSRGTLFFHGTEPQKKAAGSLRLRIIDPQGLPVSGAVVGSFALFDGKNSAKARVELAGDGYSAVSNVNGAVTVPADAVFVHVLEKSDLIPLCVFQEGRKLIAVEEVSRSEFLADKVRDIRVFPGTHVSGALMSLGLRSAGRSIQQIEVTAFKPGLFPLHAIRTAVIDGSNFEFLLPSGDWGLDFRAADCFTTSRYLRIDPGRQTVDLHVDMEPQALFDLIGHPAPEFSQVKAWKNSPPLKLNDLRGKVVLLDFWGYWCGPCLQAMPSLMGIYDEFKDRGLVVVAIHNDTANSMTDVDAKLVETIKSAWGGHNLPFIIALDGGGPTRIHHTTTVTDGATTAAYGIKGFPTTLLIDRNGVLVREIDVRDPTARTYVVQELLRNISTQPSTAR